MQAQRIGIGLGIGLSVCVAAPPAVRASNIAVSGFNTDEVLENGPLATASGFDGLGNFWVVNGIVQQNSYGGTQTAVGLPSSGVFTSQTGSGVTYQLQPYDAANALRMGDDDPQSGTLTVRSGTYAALHVLAASGTNGALPIGYPHSSDITLNFTDGSVTLPAALLAYDWFAPVSMPPTNVVAIEGLNRDLASRHIDAVNGANFGIYETALDLTADGLSGRVLESITFNNVIPGKGATSVFAVDGTPTPEPTALALLALATPGLIARRRRRPSPDTAPATERT